MKKSSFLALAIAPMILGTPLAIQAQSVSTDPVGFVKSQVNSASYTLVGVNLNKASVYGAAVESSTSDSLTVDNAGLETILGNGAYYVEVTGGPLAGDRVDVASVSGNVISLDTAAGHNTISDVSGIGDGSTFVIREHFTFADVSQAAQGDSLLGGTGAANSDQILTYEDGAFKIHFLGSDLNWYDASSFANVNAKVIAPASGFLFYSNPAGGERNVELLTLGEVRNNDVVRPLGSGFQIVSTGFPMDLSPGELGMTTEFFTGGTGAANADQILIYEGGAFKIHFLGTDDNWYSASDFSNVTDSPIFNAQGAVLVYRDTADADFRLPNQLQ